MPDIFITDDGTIRTIRMSRPDKKNARTLAMYEDFRARARKQIARMERSESRDFGITTARQPRIPLRSMRATNKKRLCARHARSCGGQRKKDVDGRVKPGHDIVARARSASR